MKEQNKEKEYSVVEVATQTSPAIFKEEKEYSIHELLVEIANELSVIKKDLTEVLESLK